MTSLQPNLNTNNFTTTQHQENLSPSLVNLSISGKTPTQDTYSDVDRIVINDTLRSIFDKNVYSKQSHAIITSYLGYHYDDSSSHRFKALIKKCNDLINISNKNKPENAKYAIILQTIYDEIEFFSRSSILPQIEQLAKSHYVVFRVIGFQEDTLGKTIREIAKDLGNRPIMTLIVRAHGEQNGLHLGNSNFYTVNDVKATDFTPLHPKATVIFSACETGINLAKKVASVVRPRSVFAYIRPYCDSSLIRCCDQHGYGSVAFDEFDNQIGRRFTFQKGYVTEAMPCCTKGERIEKIREDLFHNNIVAAKSDDATVLYYLNTIYESEPKVKQYYKNVAPLVTQAAIMGLTFAQRDLGVSYENGRGVPQSHENAIIWYKQASEQGNKEAQYYLGNYYLYGNIVPQSYEKAATLYSLSANQGHTNAQYNLGSCYYEGKGVVKSYEKAVELYTKAAQNGHAHAQFCLGFCYHAGEGVPKSLENAMIWYRKAAKQKNESAAINLKKILEFLASS